MTKRVLSNLDTLTELCWSLYNINVTWTKWLTGSFIFINQKNFKVEKRNWGISHYLKNSQYIKNKWQFCKNRIVDSLYIGVL